MAAKNRGSPSKYDIDAPDHRQDSVYHDEEPGVKRYFTDGKTPKQRYAENRRSPDQIAQVDEPSGYTA